MWYTIPRGVQIIKKYKNPIRVTRSTYSSQRLYEMLLFPYIAKNNDIFIAIVA